jgi:hypothetical protein
MRWRWLAVLSLSVPVPLAAQADSVRAVVEGKVLDPVGSPLAQTEIIWQTDRRSVMSRADGSFSLIVPFRGETVVLVRRPGFSAQVLRVDLSKGMWRGNIVLQPGSFRLPEVTVTARYAKPAEYAGTAKYDDFFRRKRVGLGTFISREDIERSNAFHTIEILRMTPGVKVQIKGNPALGSVYFGRCTPHDPDYNVTVWIDGFRQYPNGGQIASPTDVGEMISRIGPANIEMMEVYRGASQIPGEYHADGCAVVAIWTRQN